MPDTITKTEAESPAQARPQVSNRQLEQAFALFSQASDELGSTWRELESRVAHLTAELSAARSARLRELAEKEKLADKLSTLMAALPGAVVLIDREDRVEECNPAAEEMLGCGLSGRRWEDVLQACSVHPTGGEGEIETSDGRRLALVSSELSRESARIVLLTDITERLELSRILHREQRLRELGDVAARLAHQLRTPLSSAMLYLSQLDRAATEPEKAVQAGGRIRERLGHIERLIDGMMAYIQGHVACQASLSLCRLVAGVCDSMRDQAEQAGVELGLRLPEQDLVILGQEQALFEALSNLVDNALQSCAGVHGRVTVSLCRSGEQALLRVEDNGPGVTPEIRERIFDPYFSTRAHGTGLGLAVVASAVQAHGGEARLGESGSGGALFELRIPCPQSSDRRGMDG